MSGRRLSHPLVVAAVGTAVFAACLASAASRHGWDVSGFVLLGRKMPWAEQPAFSAVTRPDANVGYDGQAYFAIAQNPLADHRGRIDFPFRQTRILYPLLCHLGSFGHPPALVWVMPAVNLLLAGLLTAGGAWYARWRGVSGWWGLTLPLAVNAILPAVRDLTDLTAVVAAFGLLTGWERRAGWGWLLVLSAATVLAREQNAVVAAAVGAAALLRREWKAAGAVAAGALALPAWMLYLRGVYGEWPVIPSAGWVAMPPEGVRCWIDWPGTNLGMGVVRWVWAAFGIGQAAVVVRRAVIDRGGSAVAAVGLAGVGLAAVCGPAVYEDYWSYARALFWIPLAGWMSGVRTRWRPALWFNWLAAYLAYGTLFVM